ncbi:MAG TPA: hypothetical protein VFM49_09695, partial [Chloroflexia bacterium]|nr:hypothetical protein [Chloroflexia bacterium]
VSLLAHHSAVVKVLVSGTPLSQRTLLYQIAPAVSRTMKKLDGRRGHIKTGVCNAGRKASLTATRLLSGGCFRALL